MIVLKYPPFPLPFWFRDTDIIGIVISPNQVRVERTNEVIFLIRGEMPVEGSQLNLIPGRFDITGEPVSEYQYRIQLREQQRIVAEERGNANAREVCNLLRDKAFSVNTALNVPVKWTSGFKSVISGLTQTSSGNGRKANTVIHILLMDDLDGIIKRHKGDFLCTAGTSSNGKRWVSPETYNSGPCGDWVSEITCKQCLKLAQRWKNLPVTFMAEVVK